MGDLMKARADVGVLSQRIIDEVNKLQQLRSMEYKCEGVLKLEDKVYDISEMTNIQELIFLLADLALKEHGYKRAVELIGLPANLLEHVPECTFDVHDNFLFEDLKHDISLRVKILASEQLYNRLKIVADKLDMHLTEEDKLAKDLKEVSSILGHDVTDLIDKQ